MSRYFLPPTAGGGMETLRGKAAAIETKNGRMRIFSRQNSEGNASYLCERACNIPQKLHD
jgi:hypothetical protein